ncbi:hypothetical protein ACFQH6_16190 [Halobacteriaceae archaeon GCM10025711]
MNWKLLGVLALVVLVGGVAAFATGFGPAPGGDTGADDGSFPTETTTTAADTGAGGGSSGGSDAATTTTATAPPFTFVVEKVEECGTTCRDVTTTLTNEQSTPASDVTVHTRIFAGKGTDGDVVWKGSEPVGVLDAGESYTATRRVELSMMDAYKIKQNDGWITIQTSVTADGETTTFTEQRDVA